MYSVAWRNVLRQVEAVAEVPVNVLVLGASGTGKELIARSLHERSGRSGRFVALNCASLSAELAEKELFGHKKGAFTGAASDGYGLLHEAVGGTLFLDEVGELSPSVQAKLLRVLQERKFRRVGSLVEESCDVRVIAATHKQLGSVSDFRSDLLWRLGQYTIQLPTLAERGRDVVWVARELLSEHPVMKGRRLRLAREAESVLVAHTWPGNVRELQNLLLRLVIDGKPLTATNIQTALGVSVVARGRGEEKDMVKVMGDEPIGAGELAERLQVSQRTIVRWLKPLLEGGKVVRVGEGKQVKYRRTSDEEEKGVCGSGAVATGPAEDDGFIGSVSDEDRGLEDITRGTSSSGGNTHSAEAPETRHRAALGFVGAHDISHFCGNKSRRGAITFKRAVEVVQQANHTETIDVTVAGVFNVFIISGCDVGVGRTAEGTGDGKGGGRGGGKGVAYFNNNEFRNGTTSLRAGPMMAARSLISLVYSLIST